MFPAGYKFSSDEDTNNKREYEIQEFIGKGAYGLVYSVLDLKTKLK